MNTKSPQFWEWEHTPEKKEKKKPIEQKITKPNQWFKFEWKRKKISNYTKKKIGWRIENVDHLFIRFVYNDKENGKIDWKYINKTSINLTVAIQKQEIWGRITTIMCRLAKKKQQQQQKIQENLDLYEIHVNLYLHWRNVLSFDLLRWRRFFFCIHSFFRFYNVCRFRWIHIDSYVDTNFMRFCDIYLYAIQFARIQREYVSDEKHRNHCKNAVISLNSLYGYELSVRFSVRIRCVFLTLSMILIAKNVSLFVNRTVRCGVSVWLKSLTAPC